MVFLAQEAIIAEEKLTKYLLVPLPKDDKSQFLARAGYTVDNWQQLEQDLRTQVLTQPAEQIELKLIAIARNMPFVPVCEE